MCVWSVYCLGKLLQVTPSWRGARARGGVGGGGVVGGRGGEQGPQRLDPSQHRLDLPCPTTHLAIVQRHVYLSDTKPHTDACIHHFWSILVVVRVGR
jgi:hypothetical protein